MSTCGIIIVSIACAAYAWLIITAFCIFVLNARRPTPQAGNPFDGDKCPAADGRGLSVPSPEVPGLLPVSPSFTPARDGGNIRIARHFQHWGCE